VAEVRSNNAGEISVTDQEAFDALYSGKITSLENVYIDNPSQYNVARNINADKIPHLKSMIESFDDVNAWDQKNQTAWHMPDEYKNFNIIEFLLDKTTNEEEYQRVVKELDLFYQYDMIDVLKYIKYLVDTMRHNKIVWGVGRGSSVSSYILFLIGIHKIDSLKYDLDIREFLK
jgi:DNA polymerase III alpha subunit